MKITKENINDLLYKFLKESYGEDCFIESYTVLDTDCDHGSIGDIVCHVGNAFAKGAKGGSGVNALIDAEEFRTWAHAIDKLVVKGDNSVVIITDKGTIEVDWESRQIKFN